MAVSWDGVITAVIIVFGILAAWARWEQKKIMDLLTELKEFMQDLKSPAEEIVSVQ